MRRGHPGHLGLGGWRNENPRHFRPRSGGNQHFRPSRGYGLLDSPRFPPPGSRTNRNSQPFKQRSDSNEHTRHDSQDRGKYRSDFRSNNYQRNHEGHQPPENQVYPMKHHMRTQDSSFGTCYPKPSNYYEGSSKHYHMNNMGDIDDRYIPPRDQFRQHTISPWATDPIVNQFEDRHKYEHNKTHRYEAGESSKLPLYDYTGHRPPSSDHYHSNPTPVINNSESFNRSVDDTVNIIRKRLLNRNDPSSESNESNYPVEDQVVEKSKERTQNFHNEQSAKKKANRSRQSDKSGGAASFTKIKSKIVNQLFKMDKEKIHKLMDNPTSSSKFEYAISSLITESQYSFNRHLRSVAEKSLHTSSSIDFIQDDNNTIYEDTFMKQMQCILDPQDTVLLEDIKPIVMAELSKALQVDVYEHEHRYEGGDEEKNYQQKHDQPNLTYSSEYYDNLYNYEDYTHHSSMSSEQMLDQKYTPPEMDIRQIENVPDNNVEVECNNYGSHENNTESNYERRSRSKSRNLSPERLETATSPPLLHPRKSLDERLSELHFPGLNVNPDPDPVNSPFHSNTEDDQSFIPNAEPTLEDEDDPFAELDKQYHVAVDPSFIDNDDSSSVHLDSDSQPTNTPNSKTNITPSSHSSKIEINLNASEKELYIIKEEIEHQLQDIALSSLEFPSFTNIKTESGAAVKSERKMSVDNQLPATNIHKSEKKASINLNENADSSKLHKDVDKSDASHIGNKNSTPLSSRKRPIEQSPSHRKEKRKKSDSGHQDSEKKLQNKCINIHAPESSSKCLKKDDKRNFPEKHTKRKESHKKSCERDNDRKKHNSTDSLDTSFSPKETVNTITINKVQSKPEGKTTLKTFDLFIEQPKKVNLHQSHRNTALPVVDTTLKCSTSPPKSKNPSKIIKKHVSVQTIRKFLCKETQTIESKCASTRFTQTDKRRSIAKTTQTDAVHIEMKKHTNRSTDPLERMKEIDMEIQELLQEKFKLYSSIESRESGTNSLHSLGMAVVNVSPTEDTIVEDFTNIPVEELEQIALESVEEKQIDNIRPETRNRRVRALSKEKSKSQSPTPSQKRNNKKAKTPNISLIEQIIIDDRPIEDLISLDDLEVTPKSRPKTSKSKKKPKRKAPTKSQGPTLTSELTSGSDYILKDCTVLIVREDLSKYLPRDEEVKYDDPPVNNEPVFESQHDLAEEDHVNDIQFDMLDVSEDIVIGDICEVKSIEDKEESVTVDVPISEEIILDNSQSSSEDQPCLNSDPKENECKMFDYSSDENLRQDSIIVTGHADAVLAVECIENNFIAACLDGNVYYFSGDGQLITTMRGSNLAVTCLTIVKEKYGTTVYTGSLDSRIRYYDLDTGLEKGPECNVLSPIQTMDRAWDTVFVGTRTGFVLQFECKNNMLIPISTVQFSDQAILALRAMKEGPRKVLLVASRSEDVTIKDAQTGLLLRTLAGPKMTVYTLLYEDGKVYCGTSSSQIHVFDYSSGTHVGAHEGGKGAVCLRAAGGLVFAGCYDGCVYVYREGERRPFSQLRGPGLMLLSLAVVGTKIIAGYKDRSLYIWKIPLSILQEMIL